jgi:SAM-dependent methyltransferase
VLLPHAIRSKATVDYSEVKNLLENSGGVPLAREFASARQVVEGLRGRGAVQRNQGIEGFEGFSPDDAVFDEKTERWCLWSYVSVSGFIGSFAFANYKSPTVLDLGCGTAFLFVFLRRFGIRNYVGVDGSPVFLRFNRHLRGHEQQFRVLNLQEKIVLSDGRMPLKFDIICSFEVLEHVREDRIDSLLATIRLHMHPRSVAFLTASLTTENDVHVLVRDRGWWLERMAKVGLYPRQDESVLCQQLAVNHPWNWDASSTNIFAMQAP